VTFEADDFRPRVFYRTPTEIGVLEGPGLQRRVLRASPDIERAGDPSCCSTLEYEVSTDTLFATQPTGASADIIALDAATGRLRQRITPDGTPEALLASHARGTLRVALSIPHTRVFMTTTMVREYRAATLQPLAETPAYDISGFGMHWTVDAARGRLLAGHVNRLQAFVLGDGLVPQAAVDFGYLGLNPPVANGPVTPLPSTVRNRAFSFSAATTTPAAAFR
jgi:hypothetical protein